LDRQLGNTNEELRSLQLDIGEMHSCNRSIRRENEELRAEIDEIRSSQSSTDFELRPVKRMKKNKKPIHRSEDPESEEDEDGGNEEEKDVEEARVSTKSL
jgi:regulator of replication initiation timing